ncbi:hypothetical protein [Roseateles sp.]|uniref:hypothetical protein n=1 Tax=Roseateles sp. TaxID=1971397 RepID=UPI003BA4E2C0
MTAAATRPKRQPGLIVALVLTLAASAWMYVQDQAEDESLARPVAGQRRDAAPAIADRKSAPPANAAAAAAAEPAPMTNWSFGEREAWQAANDKQLAAWAPPPPPPPPKMVAAPPAPPAPPMAPVFPYQLLGRLVEGDQAQALLSGPNRSLAVKAGDVVDGQWRVDQVHERGLNLTWLPAKLPQTLVFRSSSS